jgi:hypothetical protein
MNLEDITPQSVYESLNSIRAQIQAQHADDQSQQAAAEYVRQRVGIEQAKLQPKITSQAIPVSTQTTDQPKSEYQGDKWMAQQKKVQEAKQYSYAKMAQANMNPDQYKQVKEALDAKYDPTGEYSKSFRDSDLYKNARTIAQEKDTGSQGQMIDLLHNTVNTISDLAAPKDMSPEDQDAYLRQQKASRIKTFLTQLVNSAKGSSDAEQSSEVLRRAFDVFTYPEIQALKNQGLMNPSGILSYLSSKNGKSTFEKIADSTTADPDAYLIKVREIHDDLAKTYNDRMKRQVFVPTSPDIAKKDFGIVEKPLFQAKSMVNTGPDVAVQVVRPSAAETPAAAAPVASRAQIAAQILQQRAAQKVTQQQAARQPASVMPQQDFTGKGAF